MNHPRPRAVSVTAVGACTRLGDVVTAAAAFRAGLKHVRVPNLCDDPNVQETMRPTLAIPELTQGFEGLGRWSLLGAAAFRDLDRRTPFSTSMLRESALWIVLPSLRHAQDPMEDEAHSAIAREAEIRHALLRRIEAISGVPVSASQHTYVFGGRIGFFRAVRTAMEALEAGVHRRCMIVAIDSPVDPELDPDAPRHDLLRSDRPPHIARGEAATCVCLEASDAPSAIGGRVLLHMPGIARVLSAPTAPPTGDALTNALLYAMNGAPETPTTGDVYIDLNGETQRKRTWELALTRLGPRYGLREWVVHTPADAFGDVGAPFGALSVALAYRAYARGYAHGDRALVLCSDDSGEYAAALVTRA